MIDRAFPIPAGATRYRFSHDGMADLVQCSPTLGIDRTKDSEATRIDGIRDMGRAGIVADEDVQFADERG